MTPAEVHAALREVRQRLTGLVKELDRAPELLDLPDWRRYLYVELRELEGVLLALELAGGETGGTSR